MSAAETQAKEAARAVSDRRRHSKTAKCEGDDLYSWALFVRGRAAYTGMSRSEAKWRRDRYVSLGVL